MSPDAGSDGVDTRTGAPLPGGAATRIPTTLGPYRVLHLLGEGGMGAVYEAEQDQPHRASR